MNAADVHPHAPHPPLRRDPGRSEAEPLPKERAPRPICARASERRGLPPRSPGGGCAAARPAWPARRCRRPETGARPAGAGGEGEEGLRMRARLKRPLDRNADRRCLGWCLTRVGARARFRVRAAIKC